MDMGSVLESELGQKWAHGVLNACVEVGSEKI